MPLQKRKAKHDKIRKDYKEKHQDPLVKSIADYYNKRYRAQKKHGAMIRELIEKGLWL